MYVFEGDLHHQQQQQQDQPPADNLYSVIYWGDSNVTVGHAFWIRCIIPISEPINWYKDGVPIQKHHRHHDHGNEDFVVDIQENRKIGDPNKIEAKLTVNRAIPRHEGRYQCNNLHENSHYVRVRHAEHRVIVTTPNWDSLEEEKNEEFHRITTNDYLEPPSRVADEIVMEQLLTTLKPLILDDNSDEEFPEINADMTRESQFQQSDFDRPKMDYDQSSSREDLTTTQLIPFELTTIISNVITTTTNNYNNAPSLITFVAVTNAPLPPALPPAQTFDKILIQNGRPGEGTGLGHTIIP